MLGQINDVDVLSEWKLLDDTCGIDFDVCNLGNGVELSISINDTSRLSSMEIDVVLSFIKFCTELSIGVSDTVNEIFSQLISSDDQISFKLIYKYMTFYGIR